MGMGEGFLSRRISELRRQLKETERELASAIKERDLARENAGEIKDDLIVAERKLEAVKALAKTYELYGSQESSNEIGHRRESARENAIYAVVALALKAAFEG